MDFLGLEIMRIELLDILDESSDLQSTILHSEYGHEIIKDMTHFITSLS